jgi:hypothetical protein
MNSDDWSGFPEVQKFLSDKRRRQNNSVATTLFMLGFFTIGVYSLHQQPVPSSYHQANLPRESENECKEPEPEQPIIVDLLEERVMEYVNAGRRLQPDPLEEELGIRIFGQPTQEDRDKLQELISGPRYAGLAFQDHDIGLDHIVVLPFGDSNKVDWGGMAEIENGRVRIFSGYIDTLGIGRHEFNHFYIRSDHASGLEQEWEEASLPYDKVELEPGRGVMIAVRYTDGTDEGVHYGYASLHGGKNWQEDICEHVDTIAENPERYATAIGHFEIYEKKFEILRMWELITESEYTVALGHLLEARRNIEIGPVVTIGNTP